MKFVLSFLLVVAIGVGFFLFFSPNTISLNHPNPISEVSGQTAELPLVPEAQQPTSSIESPVNRNGDIANQQPLQNPPKVIKGIYLTGWTAGSKSRLESIIGFMKKAGLNAVVIDIKDYSGYVSYTMDIPEVRSSGALNQIRILHPNTVIKELHDNNIYIIGRVTVFQDPILAKAHPEWALKNKSTGGVWLDSRGLAWLDPAAKPVHDYVISIAKDAFGRGFDEINFDYIRFASDGNLQNISFPFWDGKTTRAVVINGFFQYLRSQLSGYKISADLFGLSTYSNDDLGIGQVIENAYKYFDYVSPMVYPSHYAPGTRGYKNPANYPYEIISYSMSSALARLSDKKVSAASSTANTNTVDASSSPYIAKLRPWLQVFDLGAVYDKIMVQKEVNAVEDTLAKGSGEFYAGYLFWDPSNNYKALQ
ncbi:MAG: putative glycoside hydrolase [Candidatus Paceibacterales bacterium]